MKTPEQIALEVTERLSFSSNRMLHGRLVGEQYFAAQAIADALRQERSEIKRLRDALFKIQSDQLDRGTNKRLTASGHRRRAMQTRNEIIEVLDPDSSRPPTAKESS